MWTSGLQVAVARTPDKLWGLSLIEEIRNISHCGLTQRLSVKDKQGPFLSIVIKHIHASLLP